MNVAFLIFFSPQWLGKWRMRRICFILDAFFIRLSGCFIPVSTFSTCLMSLDGRIVNPHVTLQRESSHNTTYVTSIWTRNKTCRIKFRGDLELREISGVFHVGKTLVSSSYMKSLNFFKEMVEYLILLRKFPSIKSVLLSYNKYTKSWILSFAPAYNLCLCKTADTTTTITNTSLWMSLGFIE